MVPISNRVNSPCGTLNCDDSETEGAFLPSFKKAISSQETSDEVEADSNLCICSSLSFKYEDAPLFYLVAIF